MAKRNISQLLANAIIHLIAFTLTCGLYLIGVSYIVKGAVKYIHDTAVKTVVDSAGVLRDSAGQVFDIGMWQLNASFSTTLMLVILFVAGKYVYKFVHKGCLRVVSYLKERSPGDTAGPLSVLKRKPKSEKQDDKAKTKR